MAFWSRCWRLLVPSLNKRIEREMEEAKHKLLDALDDLERAQAVVTYQRGRLARLKQGEPR